MKVDFGGEKESQDHRYRGTGDMGLGQRSQKVDRPPVDPVRQNHPFCITLFLHYST
jgi:hypothetical protein